MSSVNYESRHGASGNASVGSRTAIAVLAGLTLAAVLVAAVVAARAYRRSARPTLSAWDGGTRYNLRTLEVAQPGGNGRRVLIYPQYVNATPLKVDVQRANVTNPNRASWSGGRLAYAGRDVRFPAGTNTAFAHPDGSVTYSAVPETYFRSDGIDADAMWQAGLLPPWVQMHLPGAAER